MLLATFRCRGHRAPFTTAPVADGQSGDGCRPQRPIWGLRVAMDDPSALVLAFCIGGHCRHPRSGRALSRDKAGATGNLRTAGLDRNIDRVALCCLPATGGNAAGRFFRRKAKARHRRGLDTVGRRGGSPAGDRVGRDWRANQRRRHICFGPDGGAYPVVVAPRYFLRAEILRTPVRTVRCDEDPFPFREPHRRAGRRFAMADLPG
jgi:hypothetical protein